MKVSEAILKGMERLPKQAFGVYQRGEHAACVMGCANYAATGKTFGLLMWDDALSKFHMAYGIGAITLHDHYRFPRDVIAGMFAAIGE